MSKIDTTQWKYFDILSLFDVFLADGDLQAKKLEDGEYPLISSGKTNNGICKNICKQKNSRLFQSSTITVDMFGKVFYQPQAFYAVGHGRVNMLVPKMTMSEKSGLFISAVLERQLFTKYQFNDMCSSTSLKNEKIKLPVDINGNPNFAYMEEYLQNLESAVSSSLTALRSAKSSKTCEKVDIITWNKFEISKLFEIRKGKRLTKANMFEGRIPFIGASSFNNGITAYIGNDKYLHPKNTITMSYNGSVGEAFYQEETFWASDDVNVLYPKIKFNRDIAMFIIPLLKKAGQKYAFIDKWKKEDMEKDFIYLPTKAKDEIDFDYIENYIQNKELKIKKFLTSIIAV